MFSVAVASFRSPDVLEACLDSVVAGTTARGGAVVCARRGAGAELTALREAWPDVRFVEAPPGAGVPELRGAALHATRGAALLTEDHCVADEGWVEGLLGALAAGAEVAGGAMGNARTRRAIDWGAYFAEYGFFGPDAGEAAASPSPTGANVAYAEHLVARVAADYSSGLWENVVHDRLKNEGVTFAFEPNAIVSQNLRYRFGPFLKDRFEHGRAYARRRLVDEAGVGRRLALAASTPALPFVLETRVARLAGGAFPAAFRRSVPFSLAFLSAWAAGELVGYLQGPAR